MKLINNIVWALFKNDDEPLREGYTPFQWWLRNPFHNLMHYVPPFGFKNKENKKWLYPMRGLWEEGRILNWNLGRYKLWPLFMISFKYKNIEAYFGHRSPEGVFGITFRIRNK